MRHLFWKSFTFTTTLALAVVAFGQNNGRTEKFAIPVTQTGYLVGQCGKFDVLTDFTALIRGTIVYDKSGVAVQTIQHLGVIGESIYYNSTSPIKSVLGGPAEHDNEKIVSATGIMSFSGPIFKIRIPGYGLIFAETGRVVIDLTTGQVISNSGHNQLFDQDLAALCEYLK